MTTETFELTTQHVALLKRLNVEFDNSGYDGAPAVNLKRPYGNSAPMYDIADMLGWTYDAERGLTEKQYEKAMKLHQETAIALQIILQHGKMEPGLYKKQDWLADWKKEEHRI